MQNDPFPYFEYLTQSQLGGFFGVSSHQVGRWLIEVGLRSASKQPTPKAVEGGLVKIVLSEIGPRFPVWHKDLTIAVLEQAGHKRLGAVEGTNAVPEPPPVGPFAPRKSSEDGDGYEIEAIDGTVAVWCRGEHFADRLAWLLTLADKHGRLA